MKELTFRSEQVVISIVAMVNMEQLTALVRHGAIPPALFSIEAHLVMGATVSTEWRRVAPIMVSSQVRISGGGGARARGGAAGG